MSRWRQWSRGWLLSWRRVRSVAMKEFRQLVRDPFTLGFAVGVPAAQLLLFGYAINQDIRQVPTAVVDQANSSVSRRLVGQMEASQTFAIKHRLNNEHQARQLLETGEAQVVVVIPAEFSRAVYRGRGAEVSVLVDATDPTVARAVRTAANGMMERHNKRLQTFQLGPNQGSQRASRQRSQFGSEKRQVGSQFLRFAVLNYYNPELRTPVFVVPALLGVILTTTMILMTALAIVRERERGSFEFLIATPVRRTELMAGKILPYVGIGVIQIFIVLVTGLVLFRVPVEGRVIDLLIASLVFIAANLVLDTRQRLQRAERRRPAIAPLPAAPLRATGPGPEALAPTWALRRAIERLPGSSRSRAVTAEAAYRTWILDQPRDEVAGALGLRRGALDTRLHRLRLVVRQEWNQAA